MSKKLHRSNTDKKIFGICGGIAEYLEVDATIIRIIVAILTVFTANFALAIIFYLLCAIILPTDKVS